MLRTMRSPGFAQWGLVCSLCVELLLTTSLAAVQASESWPVSQWAISAMVDLILLSGFIFLSPCEM